MDWLHSSEGLTLVNFQAVERTKATLILFVSSLMKVLATLLGLCTPGFKVHILMVSAPYLTSGRAAVQKKTFQLREATFIVSTKDSM